MFGKNLNADYNNKSYRNIQQQTDLNYFPRPFYLPSTYALAYHRCNRLPDSPTRHTGKSIDLQSDTRSSRYSDRGTQYTSESYRQTIREHHIHQSMNSAGGRCHDNARCESMWARMKTELLYDRYDTKQMTVEELKVLIWRYFLSYWNNRRICSANGGLPPMIKRRQYYEDLELVA